MSALGSTSYDVLTQRLSTHYSETSPSDERERESLALAHPTEKDMVF